MRRAAGAVVLAAVLAGGAAAAGPGPTAGATPRPTPRKPPLDFTGVWVLDETASRNTAPAMRGETLNVRQTGNQIWIEPMDAAKSHLLSESIVVDGRAYEKSLGNKGKGYVTVDWGRDGKSLWLEVTAGPDENPRQVVQRSVWKLSADRRTWVRQSVSIQDGKTKEAMLVFRRRATGGKAAPTKPR
jgi:hypothetical protein